MPIAKVTVHELHVGSTNVVRFRGLRDEVTGEYLDDANATFDLLDNLGVAVPGASPLVMTFEAGSSPAKNEYRTTISHTVPLTSGQNYTAKITAVAQDGSVRIKREACKAVDG